MTLAGCGRALASIVLAIQLGGCGLVVSDTEPKPGETAFPIGTYANCAEGSYSQNGGFMNTSGFVTGGALTLAQSGTTVNASFLDQNGKTNTFDFEVTTNTSANLLPGAKLSLGSTSICVLGVGVSNEEFGPAFLSPSAGALIYDSGTVFVSLQGVLESETKGCGPLSSSSSSWIVCQDGPSNEPIDTPTPVSIPELPVGKYTCASQLGTFYESDGLKQYVTSGGTKGTLTLEQTGADVTAEIDGDSFVAGTLHVNVTTGTTANAEGGQSLQVPCEVPIGIGMPPPEDPQTLPVAGGSLSIDDSTLFLSFAGTFATDSSCPGALKAGTVICSPN